MFLVENQIQYLVLKALMTLVDLKHISEAEYMIGNFISMVFLPPCESHLISFFMKLFVVAIAWLCFPFVVVFTDLPVECGHSVNTARVLLGALWETFWRRRKHCYWGLQKVGNPVHLLDLLQSRLVGDEGSPSSRAASDYYWDYYFRPIREIKETGNQVRRSNSRSVKTGVKFKRGLINSYLEIPHIIVDESTKTRLLNLVAYEMCPNDPSGLLSRLKISHRLQWNYGMTLYTSWTSLPIIN